MKTHIAIVAVCTLAGAVAIAGNNPGAANATLASSGTSLATMPVDDIEGLTVNGRGNQQLGDVDEVVVDHNLRKLVVIGLDNDTREVAVPLNRFRLANGGEALGSDLTAADLAGLPDYDPGDMKSADE